MVLCMSRTKVVSHGGCPFHCFTHLVESEKTVVGLVVPSPFRCCICYQISLRFEGHDRGDK
jgi:hypothetical protein